MNDNTLNNNYLASIYSIAERGMTEFNMPLTNEGKFEVLMYGIWLGLRTLDRYGIQLDPKESLSEVNSYLVKYAKQLSISSDKKAERLFVLREEEWEKDTKSLSASNYPHTKQYFPDYLYLCFIYSPLVVYSSIELSKKTDQIEPSSIADFLTVFEAYYNSITHEFKMFESDSQSYKSRASEIVNNDLSKDEGAFYSDLEQKLIMRIKNGKDSRDLSLEDLMPSYVDLAIIDKIVSEAAFSMDFLKPSPTIDIRDRYTLSLEELFKRDLDNLNAEKNELVSVIKPMYEKGLETRKRCAALIMALDEESLDERKKAISAGESLLSSIIKRIDLRIETINFVIDLKSKKSSDDNKSDENTNRNIGKTNSGCLSLLSVVVIILSSIVYFCVI